jgi:hypothetical protein
MTDRRESLVALRAWDGAQYNPVLVTQKTGNTVRLYRHRAWDGAAWINAPAPPFEYTPSLIDYATWQVGDTDAVGFSRNGLSSENEIVTGSNPWGRTDILWQGTGSGDSSADGGWNGTQFAVDSTKTYRFTCWIKLDSNGGLIAYGRAYLGLRGYDSEGTNIGVIEQDDGAVNTNPYFIPGLYNNAGITGANEWRLHVGYCYPEGSPTGAYDSVTGVYDLKGVFHGGGRSFQWQTGVVSALHRAYQYYVTTAGGQQWFYRPRVDLVDGTEPTLHELLAGAENPDVMTYFEDPWEVGVSLLGTETYLGR